VHARTGCGTILAWRFSAVALRHPDELDAGAPRRRAHIATGKRWRGIPGALVLALLAAAPASAQFDPDHNHLAGFSIRSRGTVFTGRTVMLDTRFGQSSTTVGRPVYLLAPAQKTGGPGPDPVPATAVPAFVCYKIRGGFSPNTTVHLTDQFTARDAVVRGPQLLCAPARIGTTTTTLAPTTSTSTVPTTSSTSSTSTTSTSSSTSSSSSSSSSTTTTTTTATSLITLPTLPTTLPTLP
jgi:hypothetical protein